MTKVAVSVVKVKNSKGDILRLTTLDEASDQQTVLVINGGYVVCNAAKLVAKEQGKHELTLVIPIDEMTYYDKSVF